MGLLLSKINSAAFKHLYQWSSQFEESKGVLWEFREASSTGCQPTSDTYLICTLLGLPCSTIMHWAPSSACHRKYDEILEVQHFVHCQITFCESCKTVIATGMVVLEVGST